MSADRARMHAQLRAVVERCLGAGLELPGGLVYSAEATLQRGKVYILGLNPGGDPETETHLIRHSLDQLPSQTGNDYTDSWSGRPPGEAPLQRRIKYLVESVLGARLENTFATNLIFRKTRSARSLNLAVDGDQCWPVHEAFLDIVRPEVLLTFGNSGISPYGYLLDRSRRGADLLEEEASEPSGHGIWRLRTFLGRFGGRPIRVVGFPHLSRYSPMGKPHVDAWLRGVTDARRPTPS